MTRPNGGSLDEFTPLCGAPELGAVTADFCGRCPVSNELLCLPRTVLAEQVAHQIMETLQTDEPKMFGILLCRSQRGELGYLKAFSGKWNGRSRRDGWVPPMLELEPTPLEVFTKRELEEIKQTLQGLVKTKLFTEGDALVEEWKARTVQLEEELRERKRLRQLCRQKGDNPEVLAQQSKQDSRRKREFKEQRARALRPIEELHSQIAGLKKRRRKLSRTLQQEMHSRFEGDLWQDKPWSLASLFPSGPPTGTGECCAPKLLHFAAENELEPLALAEFWWGDSTENRRKGGFYPPCAERCEPLLGPLLSQARWTVDVVYQDSRLVVVEKPSGLLTVPGREVWSQDSLLNRLESEFGELFAVHRLDMETSGLVVLARDLGTLGELQKLFACRAVEKVYEALLLGCPDAGAGRIEDGLESESNGRYRVGPDGKFAVTEFRVLDREQARVELKPLTGRSHQLRVHCAESLGCPIQGDTLYGRGGERLKLHARSLSFNWDGEAWNFESQVPF